MHGTSMIINLDEIKGNEKETYQSINKWLLSI